MIAKFPALPEHDVEEWSESGITLRYVGWSEEKVKAYAETVRASVLSEAAELADEWAMEHVIEDDATYTVGDYIMKEILK